MRSPWLIVPVALVALVPSTSSSAPIDPAARGLDAFIHVGNTAPAGSALVIDLETFGFGTVTEPMPLAGATIDLAWDPAHLGKDVSVAPAPVSVTSDASGHAHVAIPVPTVGTSDDLLLLVHMRHGSHARDRELSITRTWTEDIELHVADQRVVPGEDVTAWATLTNTATGQPIASAPVRVSLLEDGYARTVLRSTTDAAGAVMVNVPIPPIDDPQIKWTLRAELDRPEVGAHSDMDLTLRDETPGAPWLEARFDVTEVDTANKAPFTLRLRDGSWEPIASQSLRYWAGPAGTTPPKTDAAWLASSTLVTTDGSGEFHGSIDAPKLVRGGSSSLSLVAKVAIEGTSLEATGEVHVGAPVESVKVIPEARSLVPGLEQRLLLRVLDPHEHGIAGDFELTGDGLATSVTTDVNGEAEVSWRVPSGIGASRNVGPCAGGVAAAVSVRPKGVVRGLEKRTDPFSLCVNVDREATSLVRLDRTIAHVGAKVHVSIVSTTPSRDPISVVFTRGSRKSTFAPVSAWIDPVAGGDVELPESTAGVWQLTVAAPRAHAKAAISSGALLVLPRALPRLTATLAKSRLAPGGEAEIDAQLTDDAGNPLTGTVASVMVDLTGGGSMDGIVGLDTRTALCRALEISPERCDDALATTPAADALRRGALASSLEPPTLPVRDPGGYAKAELDDAFASMLRSLEGAVFESSASPDTLRDVRRKTAAGWELNPELLTLTTASMSEPPRTPGGEELSLADLLAIDKQVTFDNVARRVTRLKLVHLLADVRQQKHDRSLDDLDPIWNDPNALLRRMVSSGALQPAALLDPWGGTLTFTKAGRVGHPLLDVAPGWQLRSSGPNGVLGDGDDLTDPFVRVLAANTPYARALGEDKIVDAKWDMEVSEPSVDAWKTLLEELTGTALGGGTGTGQGFGNGHGRLGGSHRTNAPSLRGGEAFSNRRPALWTAPVRTDAQGRVHLSIKLDAIETTWGVGLVALADHAPPSTAIVKLPVALPLSARVDVSSRWVEGDEVAVKLTLRNRTQTATQGKLSLEAGGVAVLSDPKEASRAVELPASGATVVSVNIKTKQAGDARLTVKLTANGADQDTLTESWEVRPASESLSRVQSTWVTAQDTLTVPLLAGESLVGAPRLTIERGFGSALEDALASLDPDTTRGTSALAAALEVAARVKRWAEPQSDRAALAARADDYRRRAAARLRRVGSNNPKWTAAVALYAPTSNEVAAPLDACPPSDAPHDDASMLDAEPPQHLGSSLPCWDTFATDVLGAAKASNDPTRLATAVLAFGERPHRASLLSSAASSLRDLVALQKDGSIRTSGARRGDRVLVYAALLRAAELGVVLPTSEELLLGWLSVDRDARGGYGSPRATRAVVRALLGSRLGVAQPSRAKVTVGDHGLDVAVPAQGRVVVPIDASATSVVVTTLGAPFLARFARPVARSFSHPPDTSASPLHLEVAWPTAIVAGQVSTLHVTARSADPTSAIIRVPLPAGATLAEGANGVRQIQGMLIISSDLGTSDSAWDVPLRFLLRGRMTAAESRVTSDDDEPQIAPSAQLFVR